MLIFHFSGTLKEGAVGWCPSTGRTVIAKNDRNVSLTGNSYELASRKGMHKDIPAGVYDGGTTLPLN